RSLGESNVLVRAIGRAARLPREHGARASRWRDGTRRGGAAARGAGVILLMEVPKCSPSSPRIARRKTRVNALMLGTHIPEAVVIGPRNGGPPRAGGLGRPPPGRPQR